MSLEPSLTATVARLDREEALAAAEPIDWNAYRKCSQVCRAETGEPCYSLSGAVVGGRPDGVRTYLVVPHAARKRRTGRAAR